MTSLAEVVEANRMLVALGGEDQMQRIAAASIERSLELQSRIDRALAYALQTPPNSVHARNMARILDGSITVDDELNEVAGNDHVTHRLQLHPAAAEDAAAAPKRTRGPGKKKGPGSARSGLAGRSTQQRKEFRMWAVEQGYNLPNNGPVPHDVVELYDKAMEEARRMRAAMRNGNPKPAEGQLPIS